MVLKDLHASLSGVPLTSSCRFLADYVPDHDAWPVARLREAAADGQPFRIAFAQQQLHARENFLIAGEEEEPAWQYRKVIQSAVRKEQVKAPPIAPAPTSPPTTPAPPMFR